MTESCLFWTSTLDLSDYEGSSGEAIQHHLQLGLQASGVRYVQFSPSIRAVNQTLQ